MQNQGIREQKKTVSTPPVNTSRSLSQQFLDAYITDPTKNPYGQFFTTASTGTVAGDFGSALQRYGGFKTPKELIKEATALYTRQEGETARDAFLRRRAAHDTYSTARDENYQAYKQAYGKAEDLFRQQKATGFASPEEEQAARQGLAAVREATFTPYLAGRGVLEGQEALRKQAESVAREQARLDRLGGGKGEKGTAQRLIYKSLKAAKRKLQGMYQVANEAAESGTPPAGNMQTAGESLVAAMNNMGSEAASSPWYEKNRGRATYDPATKRTTPYSAAKRQRGYASRES